METFLVVDDPSFDRHRAPYRHVERPERLGAARAGMARALPEAQRRAIGAREATDAELARVHDAAHLAELGRVLARGFADVDADTYVCPESGEAARRAAGGAIALARGLLRDDARRGIALLRPPGHHAEPARAMGFCLVNNIAVAAAAALAEGASRVAIVDWDVHHGNGTQAAFYGDRRVLVVSLHQWPLYPGTGAPGEIGEGDARGKNVNVAMPPGCGPADYAAAFDELVVPCVRAHAPELVLVSAGYDGHAADPLASMRLDADAYAAMTTAMVDVASELGHGRLGLVLEGGYDLGALEESVEATLRAASGERVAARSGVASAAARGAIAATRRALEGAGSRLS